MIALVTLDFWQTLFADTPDSLRQAHVLRLEGVRRTLAEAGRQYAAADVATAGALAGESFTAVWREHRDMGADEQLRRFLGVLDPRLPGARGVGMRAIHYVPDPSVPAAPADGVLHRFAELPGLVARLP